MCFRCRTVYDTTSEVRCTTVPKKKCEMVYETKEDIKFEQQCSTTYMRSVRHRLPEKVS